MNKVSITRKSLGVIGMVAIASNTPVILDDSTVNCNRREQVTICLNVKRYNYDLSDNLGPKIEAYLNNSDSSSAVTFRLIAKT